ncbi:VOC family protein [Thiomicrorhabdus sp. 6S2-11]|jgi:glyoxylase I family protein|uniref:VOC family protein n=1 Tax=Thiomicrorhabdus marina TaxID=2818442 RepID=A0ABS3Q2V9_9GAMM|nr:VOC family protein [Thiomicrorhabdus marina]MBO1926659.1 VOC family protein [Thiomicrorhabdus marina]
MTALNTSQVLGIDHVSLIVHDSQQAQQFYQSILGLEVQQRPDLGFPGVWLNLGAGQALHLLEVSRQHIDAQILPSHGGRDFHFALRVKELAPFIERLNDHEIDYTKSKSGRQALFFRDPDGNAIELTQV